MEFEGKVAMVTGAGSGIGKAVALRLAAQRCAVGVLTRTAEEAEHVAVEIRSAGGRALPLVADVSLEEGVKAATADLVREYGRLDHVFANAGINGVWAPIDEIGPDDQHQRARDLSDAALRRAASEAHGRGLDRHHPVGERHARLLQSGSHRV